MFTTTAYLVSGTSNNYNKTNSKNTIDLIKYTVFVYNIQYLIFNVNINITAKQANADETQDVQYICECDYWRRQLIYAQPRYTIFACVITCPVSFALPRITTSGYAHQVAQKLAILHALAAS